jgi:Cu(I)-responsive transcriptional regulator
MAEATLTIGDLTKATGVKVVTIRYYEAAGLLPPPPRSQAGYRLYERRHLERLVFIRRCRDLGFTLDQVRELLVLAGQQDQDCIDVAHLAGAHLASVERKIADLQRLAAELRHLKQQCQGGMMAECRILQSLAGEC